MLRTYLDVCGPGEIGSGSGDTTDDRLLMMNPLWNQGTYAELYRCLYEMRERERHLYWHLSHRYLRVQSRRTLGCPECRQATREGVKHVHHDGMRNRKFERGWIIEEVLHPGVDPDKVKVGVTWIVAHHRGPPYLPKELYALIAA